MILNQAMSNAELSAASAPNPTLLTFLFILSRPMNLIAQSRESKETAIKPRRRNRILFMLPNRACSAIHNDSTLR